MRRLLFLVVLFLTFTAPTSTQQPDKLQIHFISVGQGDSAVLISPGGEVVLFDNGVRGQCGASIGYLQSLGVTQIDYHIASHYHSDHIGCTGEVLGMFPLQGAAYDRGGSYTTQAYTAYAAAVAGRRTTAVKGQTLTLDADRAVPVTITFAALNGNGAGTTDENDLSLVSVVRYGAFDAAFGGDLSGASTGTIDPDPGEPPSSPVCTYAVSPASHTAGTSGGAFSSSVTAPSGCAWSAAAAASWVSITGGGSGSGNGTVTFSVASNGGSARSGTATVAGRSVSFSQSGESAPPPSGGIPTCARPAGAPSSATAVCNNGDYSSSQNRGGTCSRNGGVACWICPGALCNGLTAEPGATQASVVPITASAYADIESSVAALVGRVEVYKVHHHGSRYSSNAAWLSTTSPKVGVISVGSANSYGHPTADALARLHAAGVRTYWTSVGNGAPPTTGRDVPAGDVLVEVAVGGTSFTVRYGGTLDGFSSWDAATPPGAPVPSFPFGSFDTPASGSTLAGEIAVTGWALDNTGVSAVRIYRPPQPGEPTQGNGLVFLGNATFVAGARPDLAASHASHPNAARAGWGYMLLSNMLPNGGNGTTTLYAYAEDESGLVTLLGQKNLTLNNTASRTPFGTIDTPAQGSTVSGIVDNFGWALTPSPGLIPVDGSTITVYVDSAPVGHPTYNLFRPDIAALFPGYGNTYGAVGHFALDTSTLTNGVHTLAWVVTDSLGNVSGIGSRYFTVQNVTIPPAALAISAHAPGEVNVRSFDETLDDRPANGHGAEVVVDTELSSVIAGVPFVLEGWAVDRSGAGIERLEVWAEPLTGEPAILLGQATVGVPRAGVYTTSGQPLETAGYVLVVESVPAGTYRLSMRAWRSGAGAFAPVGGGLVVAR